MPELPPLLLARDRDFHGLTPDELSRRVRSGVLARIRHGVYTDGQAWRNLKAWEQYRLRVQAAAETFQKPTVFCRHSSASVWGIPSIGASHPVQALTFKNDGGRSRAGVSRHFAALAGLNIVSREGLLVTDRIRTVLDLAASIPFTDAVAPMDHVLRPDRSRHLPALTTAELEAGIGSNYSAAAGRRIQAVIGFADPASGSAGESLSRALIHVAGFEAPVLQQPVHDAAGNLIGYADFYWKDAKVVGEFDGEEKYVKPEYLKGRSASQAVVLEKNRENRIRATGLNVVRWDWADLMAPGTLEGKLAAAGVRRRRTRSGALEQMVRP
ncbi:type IV toxin-antitoxin system AbiEi family antitoxin domain-containing protein [Arthrobacter sp. BHU FT2]|nr:type IV toxin-antitoxin system AbiEi family antitoxin domain-containing protein [Arthrobacter sp. BHU FT2]